MMCHENEPLPYLKSQGHIFSLIVDILNINFHFHPVILLLGSAKA